MGVFDATESDHFYAGFSGGNYGYGSYTPYGPSNFTYISIGKVGGPFVVDNVCIWLTTNTQLFASEDDYILVTIYDYQESDTLTYNAYIRSENIETSTNGSTCGVGKFVEIDEDGFESEVSPVLMGEVEIEITGTEGTDYGLIMAESNVEDEDSEGYSYYQSHTYWYCDGSAGSLDEGFYRWTTSDAAVILNANYNAVLNYETGERSATGFVPNNATYYQAEDGTSYTWAVGSTSVTGDTLYNNFMVESTYNVDVFSVEYDEDVILGIDFDSTYYAPEDPELPNNLLSFYFAVKELPSDVESRTTTVKLISNNAAEYPITITQYGPTAGINTITKDAEKEENAIYNLQGVLVSKSEEDLAPGVYVKNGKKFVK